MASADPLPFTVHATSASPSFTGKQPPFPTTRRCHRTLSPPGLAAWLAARCRVTRILRSMPYRSVGQEVWLSPTALSSGTPPAVGHPALAAVAPVLHQFLMQNGNAIKGGMTRRGSPRPKDVVTSVPVIPL